MTVNPLPRSVWLGALLPWLLAGCQTMVQAPAPTERVGAAGSTQTQRAAQAPGGGSEVEAS
ncbi:MAG: hypothetical protein ACO38G_09235, partial [Burkholderiaceae bacterium]